MRNLFILALCAAMLYSCNQPKNTAYAETDPHAGHDHVTEEGDDHEAEGIDEHAGHNHEAEETVADSHANEIIFTEAQAAQSDFALAEVIAAPFHEVIRTFGEILPAQGDETQVVAPVSGIVTFGSTKLAEGGTVSKSANLFYISSKNVADGDYALRTRATYEQAKSAFNRAENLIGDKIISQADYDQAKLNYETARVSYNAVASNSSDRGTAVQSPMGGFLKELLVNEGAYVEKGQTLAVVSQNRRLILRAELSQKYFNRIGSFSGANFKTPYDDRLYTLKELNGRLLSSAKSASTGNLYLPVTFEFDNRGNLVSGAMVEVFLLGAPQANSLTVPLTALTEEQGNFFVYVQLDAEGYQKREVKVGANDGIHAEILSGLKAGEKVVSRGAYRVKLASFSGAIPHGHQH